MTEEELASHYDEFFQDIFWELEEKFGKIEQMNICDNLGDHLVGNVYVMFDDEEDAEKACEGLNNRWFDGRPITAELSPVTDFREACCRQYVTILSLCLSVSLSLCLSVSLSLPASVRLSVPVFVSVCL